jgi:thiol-disulfide isomerase/thioredoxin
MSKTINNQKVTSLLKILKPWAIMAVLLVVLRYTGAISGLSYITQSALFETGAMDFDPAENKSAAASFNYNFILNDLEGNKVDVTKFKGKVIFLNMWATWCGPCRVEMPSIQKLYESVDKDKVVFIMLSIDSKETQSKISKYINDKGFTFPVYTPHEYLPRQLNVPTIPTTFIVSKDGKVKSKKVGTANYDTEEFKTFLNGLANQ